MSLIRKNKITISCLKPKHKYHAFKVWNVINGLNFVLKQLSPSLCPLSPSFSILQFAFSLLFIYFFFALPPRYLPHSFSSFLATRLFFLRVFSLLQSSRWNNIISKKSVALLSKDRIVMLGRLKTRVFSPCIIYCLEL